MAQPGDRLIAAALNGQLDVGNLLFQLLPAFPHEGPPIPRVLLTRRGFEPAFPAVVLQPVVAAPVAQVVPAVLSAPPVAAPAVAPRQYIPQIGELGSPWHRPVTSIRRITSLPGL